MTTRSIGLLSLITVCAAATSISIASCDSNSNPATPGSGIANNGGKGPQVLSDPCAASIGSLQCPVGEATISYNENGDLAIGNFNGERSGYDAQFAAPINVWHAAVNAVFPSSGDGFISYEARSEDQKPQARIDINQQGTEYTIRPTFTSPPDGGKSMYDVQIHDANGYLVAVEEGIDITKPIYFTPACTLKLQTVSWNVYSVNNQCIWRVLTNPCCNVQWQLPDGRLVNGNQITLTERNEKGFYVYLQTSSIATRGNLPSYSISSASAAAFQ